MAEPMNAGELLSYHVAAAGTLQPGGSIFYTTEYTENEVKEGIKTVGGKVDNLKVVPMPNNGEKWTVPPPKKGVRVVFDSYSQCLLQWGWKDAFNQLRKLKQQTQEEADMLFISCTTNLHTEMERTMIRQWADGVLELGFDRQGFGLYPYMKLTKMRGVTESARFLLFKETERGLFMESTKRVF
jgi:hypothetical protein